MSFLAAKGTIDYEEIARWYIDKADEWANRENVRDPEFRKQMVDYHLRLAEIHATLNVGRELRNVKDMLAVVPGVAG